MAKKLIIIDSYIGRWGYSKTYVRNMLAEANGSDIEVQVSSLGGEVDHAIDIHDQFAEYKGNIEIKLTGFIASAATFIPLACKTRISENAFYLIHKVLSWVDEWGMMNEDDIDQVIEKLTKEKKENEKITLSLAKRYAERAKTKGKSLQDVLDLMKQDTWITAQEAFDWGFVDEVYKPTKTDAVFSNSRMAAVLSAAGLPVIPTNRTPVPPVNNNPKTEIMKNLVLPRVNAILSVTELPVDEENGIYIQEEQLNNIESAIETLSTDVASKTSEITALGGQIIESTTQINTLTQTIADRDNTIAENATEIETLRTNANQVEPLTNQVNELTQTISERDAKITDLESQIVNISNRLLHTPGARAINFSGQPNNAEKDGADWNTIDNLPHNKEVDSNT